MTTWSRPDAGTVVTVEAVLTTLRGVTITGGTGTESTSRYGKENQCFRMGGGLLALDPVELVDVVFLDNDVSAEWPADAVCDATWEIGGGAMLYDAGEARLEDVRFEGNAAGIGGGLSATWDVDVNAIRLELIDNRARDYGAGLDRRRSGTT